MSESGPETARLGINRLIWVGLALTGALLGMVWLFASFNLAAISPKPLPILGQVADFTLTNQEGRAVSLSDLRGHVWVADVIFTRCPGPCLKMSRQMHELQLKLPSDSAARLVTLTTDPGFDTPPVLKTYAGRFGADPARWWFLTGTKPELSAVATGSLKLTAIDKTAEQRQSPDDLFVHSTIMVLVDKKGQLRGVFETTGAGVEPRAVQTEMLARIKQLERES